MNPKLVDFLKAHSDSLDSQGIRLSLGDSFLYKNNRIYKLIRDEFLRLGYSFTDQDFCHYNVLPYASLEKILKTKKVPYFDNATVLQEIEHKHPCYFHCHDLVRVKPNYTLHESCHCIIDHFLKDLSLNDTQLSSERKKAFTLILAEAFANTIESLANIYNSSTEHRLFFELNSYITHSKKINQFLIQCIDLIGFNLTFRLVYMSYIFSNCLFVELSNKAFQDVLATLITDINLRKKATDSFFVRKIFNHAFELNFDFCKQTTSFYFSYVGIKVDLSQLSQIDILAIYNNSPLLTQIFKKYEVLLSPTEPLS